MIDCDRHWLLTWTTYGTWLPGDARGFVSAVRDRDGRQVIHNVVGTAFDKARPALRTSAQQRLLGPPVFLTKLHAEAALRQFVEHAAFRNHVLEAAAVMSNHCHLVIGVSGDPSPSRLLGDYKSYVSRALNAQFDRPQSGTWWTESGSKRKLPDSAVERAVEYVRRQHRPLVIWTAARWQSDK